MFCCDGDIKSETTYSNHTMMSLECHDISNYWQFQLPVFQWLTTKKIENVLLYCDCNPLLTSGLSSPVIWKVFPQHDIIKSHVCLFLRQLDLLEVLMSGLDSGMIHRGCQSFSATIVSESPPGTISEISYELMIENNLCYDSRPLLNKWHDVFTPNFEMSQCCKIGCWNCHITF